MTKLTDHTVALEQLDRVLAVRGMPSASVLVYITKKGASREQMELLASTLADRDLLSMVISEELLVDVRRIPAFELKVLEGIMSEARHPSLLPGIEELIWARKYGSGSEDALASTQAAAADLTSLGWARDLPTGRWTDPKPRPDGTHPTHDFLQACQRALTRQRIHRERGSRQEPVEAALPDPDEIVSSLMQHEALAEAVLERLQRQLRE